MLKYRVQVKVTSFIQVDVLAENRENAKRVAEQKAATENPDHDEYYTETDWMECLGQVETTENAL